jgi:hypothetical protein
MCNHDRVLHPGWCNGNAGHAMLFALACEVYGHDGYRSLAVAAVTAALDIKTTLGSLCCGNAGNGYAYLAAHRISGDSVWLRRARQAAKRAAADQSPYAVSYVDALYKGALGVSLLTADVAAPATAAMPLFEAIRTSR